MKYRIMAEEIAVAMELRNYGYTEIRRDGGMEIRKYGSTELWRELQGSGITDLRKHGRAE